MSPKNFALLFVFIILLMSGLIAFSIVRKKKRKEEIDQLTDRINSGVGAEGEDFAKLLYNVKPDTSYTGGAMMAKKIKEAKGIFNDDENAVYSALSGKTKGQIKTIQLIFEKAYGNMDQYLRSFLKDSEFDKALYYVKTAR